MAIFAIAMLATAPANASTLRERYDSCVTSAYLDLLVDGRSNSPPTAEAAVQACETELQSLYSFLINTDMKPKQALWMVSTIRLTAKSRLLSR